MIENTMVNLINRAWPMLLLITISIVTFKVVKYRNGNDRLPLHREISDVLFVLYMYLLLDLVTTVNGNSGINLMPFAEMFRHPIGSDQFVYNVVWNIFVFVPIGYFISRYANIKKVSPIILVSLFLSFSIEFVQLRIGRSFDIDDIILNVVGGICGFLIYIALDAIRRHLPGIFQKDFLYNIIAFIVVILVILYFASILGFRWA